MPRLSDEEIKEVIDLTPDTGWMFASEGIRRMAQELLLARKVVEAIKSQFDCGSCTAVGSGKAHDEHCVVGLAIGEYDSGVNE